MPSRACIALDQRYQLGHLFAERAAEIPLPEEDLLFVRADIYNWRALDEQAVCASGIGKHEEAFALCRRLLARRDIPEDDRTRIAANRDVAAPTMIDAAVAVSGRAGARAWSRGRAIAEVTVSLVAGPDRAATEQTLNSFLRCCIDVSRVGRFLVLDAGLSAPDRAALLEWYRFIEFSPLRARGGPGAQLARTPRRDRWTVLAAPGSGLAVLRPRAFHQPPDRGSRGRTRGVPGGDQLR